MQVRRFPLSVVVSLALLCGVILLVHASAADETQAVSVTKSGDRAQRLSPSNRQLAGPQLYPEIAFTPVATLYLPVAMNIPRSWALSNSSFTTCAEEDNVNVPHFAPGIIRFQVTATHPRYDVGTDNCLPDFSGCPRISIEAADLCANLYDDGTNVVQGCVTTQWWRPYTMNIVVGTTSGSYHSLRLYRKIQGENSWPQVLVLYQDGNMRLKPHPPLGRPGTCFGSSVIIGPAIPSMRPYVDIQEVRVDPSALTLDITFRDKGTAHISLSVSRDEANAWVNVGYATSITIPFATFRSMYVSDGNADVDHIQCPAGDLPILTGWTTLEGPWWFFHRTIRSIHNTSAPDIRIEVLD